MALNAGLSNFTWITKEDCTYTKCFCEENVWKLCDSVRQKYSDELKNCFVIFVSNEEKMIPMWCQQASDKEDKLVVWDYHVIAIMRERGGWYVYDLDTTLDFPCNARTYIHYSFHPERCLKKEFQRCYRIIPASAYLENFSSDRSHMIDEEGKWRSPPPTYPCILSEIKSHSLNEFIDMTKGSGIGVVVDDHGLIEMFGMPFR